MIFERITNGSIGVTVLFETTARLRRYVLFFCRNSWYICIIIQSKSVTCIYLHFCAFRFWGPHSHIYFRLLSMIMIQRRGGALPAIRFFSRWFLFVKTFPPHFKRVFLNQICTEITRNTYFAAYFFNSWIISGHASIFFPFRFPFFLTGYQQWCLAMTRLVDVVELPFHFEFILKVALRSVMVLSSALVF